MEISSPLPFLGDVKDFDKSKLGASSAIPVKPLKARVYEKPAANKWGVVNGPRLVDECNAQLPRESDIPGWSLLLERARSRLVVPFVGAGMSCPLLPGWLALLERVAERLNCPVAARCSKCGQPGEKLPILTEVLREKLEERHRRSSTFSKKRDAGQDGSKLSKNPTLERSVFRLSSE